MRICRRNKIAKMTYNDEKKTLFEIELHQFVQTAQKRPFMV